MHTGAKSFSRKDRKKFKIGEEFACWICGREGSRGAHLMSYRTAVELGIVITMDDDRTVNRVGKPADTKLSLQRWSWTLAVDQSGATRFRRS